MQKLKDKIKEITGFECSGTQLHDIESIVINTYFKNAPIVSETYIADCGFKFNRYLDNSSEFFHECGTSLYYDFKENILTVYDAGNNLLLANAKIHSSLQFSIIMESLQFNINE